MLLLGVRTEVLTIFLFHFHELNSIVKIQILYKNKKLSLSIISLYQHKKCNITVLQNLRHIFKTVKSVL